MLSYLRHNNFGVEAESLTEYEKFVELFSNFLWAIDAYYDKLVARGYTYSDESKELLGFNNPKKHKHSACEI